jgi:hypothetical protein
MGIIALCPNKKIDNLDNRLASSIIVILLLRLSQNFSFWESNFKIRSFAKLKA